MLNFHRPGLTAICGAFQFFNENPFPVRMGIHETFTEQIWLWLLKNKKNSHTELEHRYHIYHIFVSSIG